MLQTKTMEVCVGLEFEQCSKFSSRAGVRKDVDHRIDRDKCLIIRPLPL